LPGNQVSPENRYPFFPREAKGQNLSKAIFHQKKRYHKNFSAVDIYRIIADIPSRDNEKLWDGMDLAVLISDKLGAIIYLSTTGYT
jgi:hypothetical protein